MSHHLGGLVFHGHDPWGVTQGAATAQDRVAGKQRGEDRLIPMQNSEHLRMLRH